METRAGRPRTTQLCGAVAVAFMAAAIAVTTPAPADASASTSWGYIPMSDGTQLRYTLFLPPGPGPFPALLNYQGYNAGTDPGEATWVGATADLPARGYAVIGVSVRGTGCSSGDFAIFDPVQATDGAAVVEWIAQQPWSSGKVGMFGLSYGGIMQLLVAAERPPHLVAIAPGAVAVDLYRDVGMPGGIPNVMTLAGQTASFERGRVLGPAAAATDVDAACFAHQMQRKTHYTALHGVEHPYWDEAWKSISPSERLDDIRVPVMNVVAWQDEQVSSRKGYMEEELAPGRTWTLGMNGHHGMYMLAPLVRHHALRFFDRYLKGEQNGWELTPRLQVYHEVGSGRSPTPSWTTAHAARPRLMHHAFYAAADGSLQPSPGANVSDTYLYPLLSPSAPSVLDSSAVTDQPDPGAGWQVQPTPAGFVAFQTPPLGNDMELLGPASADLWISSTATDADVQVTVTEVLPDGREMYVQRGWLRLSHRALDPARSTVTRPFHTHVEADVAPLTPGVPVLARVEIPPFNHVFRSGSRLRVTIDAPTGHTGLFSFDFIKTPSLMTIHHGERHPSRFVFGMTRPTDVPAAAPCGTLINQPCRTSVAN